MRSRNINFIIQCPLSSICLFRQRQSQNDAMTFSHIFETVRPTIFVHINDISFVAEIRPTSDILDEALFIHIHIYGCKFSGNLTLGGNSPND